jgi:hypothetical protein
LSICNCTEAENHEQKRKSCFSHFILSS